MHSDTTINLHENYFVHRDGIFDEKEIVEEENSSKMLDYLIKMVM